MENTLLSTAELEGAYFRVSGEIPTGWLDLSTPEYHCPLRLLVRISTYAHRVRQIMHTDVSSPTQDRCSLIPGNVKTGVSQDIIEIDLEMKEGI